MSMTSFRSRLAGNFDASTARRLPRVLPWVVALALTPALLFAAPSRPSVASEAGPLLQRAIQRLDLTPDQLQQVKDILRSHQAELESEVKAVVDSRTALFDSIHADPPSDSTVRAAAARVGLAESNLAVTRSHVAQEVRQVLTPEQQAELKNMLADAHSLVQALIQRLHDRFSAFLG